MSWYLVTVLLWWFAGFTIAIVVHEAGHALCAVIGSIPITLLSIGVGPVLLRGRLGNTQFEFRLLPLAGFVMPKSVLGIRRRWLLLFLLGGVLGNIALIGFIACLESLGALRKLPRLLLDGLGPAVFAQVWVIVVSLIPFHARANGARRASDGLQLLWLLRSLRQTTGADPFYMTMLSRYSEGQSPQLSDATPRIMYHVGIFERWTDAEVRRTVHEAFEAELARKDLSREEELLVLDCLVTDALIYGDPRLRSRLDEWSQRALQLGPRVKPVLASRGAVLVALGRYEEGKALLQSSAVAGDSDAFGRLMRDIFLARAEHTLGNVDSARRLIAAVGKASKVASALPGVMALIARTESQLASGS